MSVIRGHFKGKDVNKGDFLWDEELAEGSCSTVHAVTYKGNNNQYAIKKVRKIRNRTFRNKELISVERNALERLDSPYCIGYHGCFDDDDNCTNYILELCPYDTMKKMLKKKKRLRKDVVVHFAAELVMALEHFREKEITHRGITNKYIVLNRKGHLKIINFKAAKLGKDRNQEGSEYLLPNNRGILFHECERLFSLSPEICNFLYCSYATDFWFIGVFIFNAISGDFPFSDLSRNNFAVKITDADITWPEKGVFDGDTIDVIKGLITKDQEDRFGYTLESIAKLKKMAFFNGIDWKNLHKRHPVDIWPKLFRYY